MKTYLRIGLVILVTLAMIFTGYPALAKTVKTEITGKLYPLTSGEIAEKYWETGNSISHARTENQGYYLATSDPRLNGWGFGTMDWELNWYPDGSLRLGHIRGPMIVTADELGTEILWECTTNATLDDQWNFVSNAVCHGAGENKGLMAKITLGNMLPEPDPTAPADFYYPMVGSILDTNGE